MAIVAGKFKIEKEIGRGSYATVYSAILIQPYPPLKIGDYVAIKSISTSRISSATEKEKLENEISLMKTLNHKNIVRLYGVERLRSYYFLIMEYCNDGDLIHFLHSYGDKKCTGLPEDLIINFIYQIGQGLQYLHSHHIVHRDLKPHNILISKTTNNEEIDSWNFQYTLKIADFGFARFLRPSDLCETICGSPIYMAPEIQFGTHYSSCVDMWSVGVILYELASGRTPFPHIKSQFELAQELKSRGSHPYCLPVNAQVSEPLRQLVPRLLTIDAEKRMKLSEFLDSSIFHHFKSLNEQITNSLVPHSEVSTTTSSPSQNLYKFSFLAADGSIDAKQAEHILTKAKEAAAMIYELFNDGNDQNLVTFEVFTNISSFLIDFLTEYKSLVGDSIDPVLFPPDGIDINHSLSTSNVVKNEELERSIIDLGITISNHAYDCMTMIKEQANDQNHQESVNINQELYNRAIHFAQIGADAEKVASTNEEMLSFTANYRKALQLLMPIAYQSQSNEFTAFVRDLYMKLSDRLTFILNNE